MPPDSTNKTAIAWKSLRLERFLKGKWRSKISETAAWVYLGYLTHADNDEAGKAYPGAKRIAGLLEIRVDTVKKARRELIAAGLLTAVDSAPGLVGCFRVEIPPVEPESTGGVLHPHRGAGNMDGGGVGMLSGGGVERRLESIIQSNDESGPAIIVDLLCRGGMKADDAIRANPHFTSEALAIAVENLEAEPAGKVKSKSGYVCDQIRRGKIKLTQRAIEKREAGERRRRPKANGNGSNGHSQSAKFTGVVDLEARQNWAREMKDRVMAETSEAIA